MKANEAPEKIYMTPSYGEPDNVLLASFSKSHLDFHRDIEYTRTDAFIKKALKWYCLDCACNDSCKYKCAFWSFFKDYLGGNDKALPPKIENAFNPDGSTTDNYRYRHFIERMQDAFIEKACAWLKENGGSYWMDDYDLPTDELVKDFRKYMEGETL